MKKLFLLAFAAAALAACSDDDSTDFTVCPHGSRVSFESEENLMNPDGKKVIMSKIDLYSGGTIAYSKENIFWAKDFAVETDDYDQLYWQGPYIYAFEGEVMFGGYYDDGTLWDTQDGEKVSDTWGGFVLSQNFNQSQVKSDWSYQFDVWAKQGANGTKTFAVGYDSNTAGAGWLEPKEYNAPQIDFAHPVKPYRVFIANSTYTYTYFSGEPTDSFVLEITGWKDDVKISTVSCKLIDGANKINDWVSVDLSVLGEVNKLTFKTIASDISAPCYFCLDDLCFDR